MTNILKRTAAIVSVTVLLGMTPGVFAIDMPKDIERDNNKNSEKTLTPEQQKELNRRMERENDRDRERTIEVPERERTIVVPERERVRTRTIVRDRDNDFRNLAMLIALNNATMRYGYSGYYPVGTPIVIPSYSTYFTGGYPMYNRYYAAPLPVGIPYGGYRSDLGELIVLSSLFNRGNTVNDLPALIAVDRLIR